MKFIFLYFSVLTTLVFGEPPPSPSYSPYGRIALRLPQNTQENSEGSRIVDQRLLDKVADIISQGGEGEAPETEGLSVVDSELFERIARIISQNDGQVSGLGKSSSSNTNPSAPGDLHGSSSSINTDYGVPLPSPSEVHKLTGVGKITLGQPVAAKRLASFDIQDETQGGYSNSQSAGYTSSDSFSSRSGTSGALGSRIRFITQPEVAERIAAFDVPDVPLLPQTKSGYQH